jgi:hypothetical protein
MAENRRSRIEGESKANGDETLDVVFAKEERSTVR